MVVRTALYGRMQVGRCISSEPGHVGCYGDVVGVLDMECSGTQQCYMTLPDSRLEHIESTTCIKGVFKYLEMAYDCVEGKTYGKSSQIIRGSYS